MDRCRFGDAGDIVVVTRLDRLGRSLPHLLSLVEDLTAPGSRCALRDRK